MDVMVIGLYLTMAVWGSIWVTLGDGMDLMTSRSMVQCTGSTSRWPIGLGAPVLTSPL